MNSSLAAREQTGEAIIASHYRKVLVRRFALAGVLLFLILCSLILDFILGPSGISVSTLWHTLMDAASVDAGTRVIVWELRLPFALMAVAVGMALGLAGAEMQTILNNPLASPFTLGVSSAASFGAALAIVLGLGIPGIADKWFIPANAFVFALLACFILDGISRWTRVATSGVVLFGIALVFTFNALISILQFVASEDTLQGLVFWTMGSLARASWDKLAILAVALLIIVPLSLKTHGNSRRCVWAKIVPSASALT